MSPTLVLNAGSSSVKFALFGVELRPLFRGKAENNKTLEVRDADGKSIEGELPRRPDDPVAAILTWLQNEGLTPQAVGHRVVHGGDEFADAVRLTESVVDRLRALTPLAPLHQPASLAPIEAIRRAFTGVPQFAAFDTSFHRTIAGPQRRYALPRDLEAQGIRRYGFHGLSYAHVASRLPAILPGRRKVIAAHLGSGASLCALLDGRSIDTTMGFSALDGLVMATRPGLLDPGILLFLLKEKGMSPDEVEDLLYHRSGLLGVSDLSGDIRELASSEDTRAREAIALFAFRIARETAALANSLEGLDALVFTGGIGEHSPLVRRLVCEQLSWLGVSLDEAANEAGHGSLEAAGSRIAIRVVEADEELAIAKDMPAFDRAA